MRASWRSLCALLAASWLAGCDTRDGAAADAGLEDADVWPDLPVAPQPEEVLTGLSSPCGLAVLDDGLYLAETGAGRVLRLALPTGATSEVVRGLQGPSFLARSGSDLVVTDRRAGTVVRVRAGVAAPIAEGQANPGRVAAAGGFAYWIVQGSAATDGALRRAPIDGGPVEDLATRLAAPNGLSVTSARAYFTETGAHTLGYVPLIGGAPPTRVSDPLGRTFDVLGDERAGQLFWTSPGTHGGGLVHRAGLDLGGDRIVSYSPPGPGWLALAGDDVVWTTSYSITRAPRDGGDYHDVAVYTASCDLAVAAGAVYWTDAVTGRLLRRPLP